MQGGRIYKMAEEAISIVAADKAVNIAITSSQARISLSSHLWKLLIKKHARVTLVLYEKNPILLWMLWRMH